MQPPTRTGIIPGDSVGGGEDVQKTPLPVQTLKNQRNSQDTCHKPEESSSSVCYLTPRCKSTVLQQTLNVLLRRLLRITS